MMMIMRTALVCFMLMTTGHGNSQKSKMVALAFGCCLEDHYVKVWRNNSIIFSNVIGDFNYQISGEYIFNKFYLRRGEDSEIVINIYANRHEDEFPVVLALRIAYESIENGSIVEFSYPDWERKGNNGVVKWPFIRAMIYQYKNKKSRRQLIKDVVPDL